MRNLPLLIPSIKRSIYRMNDVGSGENMANIEYLAVRGQSIDRDGTQCQFCGVKPSGDKKSEADTLKYSGYLESHHIDDDHNHNVMSNLATACHACHQVFHVGFAGSVRSGTLILLPGISQAELNMLCHAIGVAVHSNDSEEGLVNEVRAVYKKLLTFEKPALELFGVTDLASFGTLLAMVANREPERYKTRDQWLSDIKILPNIDYFSRQYSWWSKNGWTSTDAWPDILADYGL